MMQKLPKNARIGADLEVSEDKATLMVAYSQKGPKHRIFPLETDAPSVTLDVEVPASAEAVWATATRGPYDTADCAFDPMVTLPNIRATCPLHGTEPTQVSIIYRERGRLLSEGLMDATLRPLGMETIEV